MKSWRLKKREICGRLTIAARAPHHTSPAAHHALAAFSPHRRPSRVSVARAIARLLVVSFDLEDECRQRPCSSASPAYKTRTPPTSSHYVFIDLFCCCEAPSTSTVPTASSTVYVTARPPALPIIPNVCSIFCIATRSPALPSITEACFIFRLLRGHQHFHHSQNLTLMQASRACAPTRQFCTWLKNDLPGQAVLYQG